MMTGKNSLGGGTVILLLVCLIIGIIAIIASIIKCVLWIINNITFSV